MYRRSKEKVRKSKEAAIFLHSPHALAVANITRSAAAATAQQSLNEQLESKDVLVGDDNHDNRLDMYFGG